MRAAVPLRPSAPLIILLLARVRADSLALLAYQQATAPGGQYVPAAAERNLVGAAPTRSRERLGAVVPNLMSIPGYVASYTVGALEIERLRAEAERALGDRFDLRAFHDVLLRDGAVPLALVRTRVARWVRERSQPGGSAAKPVTRASSSTTAMAPVRGDG